MGEFAGVRADIDDDALRSKRDMPADAVFARKLVKPRAPSLAVKLPAKRRGDGDFLAFDMDEYAVRGFLKSDIGIAAETQRRKRALALQFQALDERQLQVNLRKARPLAIMRPCRPVTRRGGEES